MRVPRTRLVLATGAPPFLPPSFACDDSSLHPVMCCASPAQPRACVRRMPWCRGLAGELWDGGCSMNQGSSGSWIVPRCASLTGSTGTAGVHLTPQEQLLEQVLNREHPRTQGPDNGVTRCAKVYESQQRSRAEARVPVSTGIVYGSTRPGAWEGREVCRVSAIRAIPSPQLIDIHIHPHSTGLYAFSRYPKDCSQTAPCIPCSCGPAHSVC